MRAEFENTKAKNTTVQSLKSVIEKKVAKELLETLKDKLKDLYHWQDREPSRDTVKVMIRDFLWNETTGLPVNFYTDNEVEKKTEEVFYHIYRAYPTVPSPYYAVAN